MGKTDHSSAIAVLYYYIFTCYTLSQFVNYINCLSMYCKCHGVQEIIFILQKWTIIH